ncbi:hypothetical protein LC065_13620 [Halobacillus litoralis]|uniref:hypothetical protein n=1 Tax=Halobacillus litoralis TaxID=45668 RepID=UPI001CFD6BA6|nr:hypothetical protein [Halobacillus litoralis]WLR46603.1 hypothetical protein LC065_13620 [Halobacillus litoralis]
METFVLLRPVFLLLVIVSILLTLFITFQKEEKVNGWTLFFITSMSLIIGSVCLYSSGYIVDEFGMSGDPMSFYLYIALFPVSLLNILVYSFKPRLVKEA